MGVLEFATGKARSLAAATTDHQERRHVHKGGDLARIETRRRQEAGHGVSTPKAHEGAASPVGPPTPPRRPPEARSEVQADAGAGAGARSHPPGRDIMRRVDEEAADKPGAQFLAAATDFLHDFSDTESSVSYSMYRSTTPSPAESPTCAVRLDDALDHDATTLTDSDDAPELVSAASIAGDREVAYASAHIVDFGDAIWCPPPPEDERDDVESRIFGFDDDDDDDAFLQPSCFSDNKTASGYGAFGGSQQDGAQNDLLKHFRALVAQLLKAEGISFSSDDNSKSWLEIVSSLAWQAANYVKPDTKKGGSMDPGDYVKIKCIASGNPTDSNFVRGIVCSKNVRHKRMVSEHRNAKLLILGGALEYQKVSNKLASIGTIIEQEKEYLRTVVGKIESRQPNVLLVEKSASSFAQELLAKDISLVLNVKRPLLDRISRCTGGQIASSIDNIASARLGHCDLFKVEKVSESLLAEHGEKGSIKTLMFFEGCLKRLGCTVLLRGTCREELKKIKRAMQLAVFAAYHLSLETSFLADEGATLPKIPSISVTSASDISASPTDHGTPDGLRNAEETYPQNSTISQIFEAISASSTLLPFGGVSQGIVPEYRASKFPVDPLNSQDLYNLCHPNVSCNADLVSPCSVSDDFGAPCAGTQHGDSYKSLQSSIAADVCHDGVFTLKNNQPCHSENPSSNPSLDDFPAGDTDYEDKLLAGSLSGTDNNQSILVSLSSTCIPKSLACQRSHLLRIKFYGSFDKPLGRYLREDLFDQAYCCPSCKEPSESHVRCYMHQHGSLTISVRRLQSQKLSGEHDGRIWMWHRCMRCKLKDGMPPATHRVIMSDAAWGLSFGKFLELSFSTANRIASCGHSLQRDCVRFYGYGNMVAAFHYGPMTTLSVDLPPPVLDFSSHATQDWVKREAVEVFHTMELLHTEVYDVLHNLEKNIITDDDSTMTSIQRQIVEMKDLLNVERNEYEALLLPVIMGSAHSFKPNIDILELNRIRRSLLLDAHTWDCRLCGIDSFEANGHISRTVFNQEKTQGINEGRSDSPQIIRKHGGTYEEPCHCPQHSSESPRKSLLSTEGHVNDKQSVMVETDLPVGLVDGVSGGAGGLDLIFNKFDTCEGCCLSKYPSNTEPVERLPSLASILADKIDMAWSGFGELDYNLPHSLTKANENRSLNLLGNPSYEKATAPVRIHSFDTVMRLHRREQTGVIPTSLHSAPKSVDSFRDLTSLVKDPMTNMRRAFSQISPRTRGNLNTVLTRAPKYITSASHMVNDGARLLLPNISCGGSVFVTVYDDEPTSAVSYAMTSQEYADHVTHKMNTNTSFSDFTSSNGLHRSLSSQEDLSNVKGTHFRLSFDDDASPTDSTKFSVTCYFARQFAALRKKCCPSDIDYIRSISRCKRWSAHGGKSNVYFAKTMDERFIIKQVTKTELDSFVEFAPHYFRHLTESLTSRSPTCLAKIMGLYQVSIKNSKGGREVKMDLMVMENIFFQRSISRVYDLKGSVRSRYNSDASGHNKVLLDSNLIEALHTKPMFLGSKEKQRLERAVWNDTSFLASLDVMDYSLLVGVDEEKNELVVGIIDFLRQYTWDKQLETWVKASGILGGPKNEAPTVISPIQYKKRFRKAMSRYFLAVPDQWTS